MSRICVVVCLCVARDQVRDGSKSSPVPNQMATATDLRARVGGEPRHDRPDAVRDLVDVGDRVRVWDWRGWWVIE